MTGIKHVMISVESENKESIQQIQDLLIKNIGASLSPIQNE